uniref:At1g61320/AtMIF1 LRR domain-containing protein n=2 Tax=Aegilops tauschii TaxID=37682 RepID=A0A453DFU3_AEGTS
TGFCSSKKLVQFVIYILEGSPQLECLTLDTTPGPRYSTKCGIIRKHTSKKMGICCPMMTESNIAEAHEAVKAANTYIAGRVPLGVGLQVLEPCSECNNPKWW